MNIVCTDENGISDNIPINNGKSFKVSYFNSPLCDNFTMPDGDRIAIILKELKGEKKMPDTAIIDIIHFPGDYVTAGARPSVDRVNKLIDGKN